jgi:hypothetical protein
LNAPAYLIHVMVRVTIRTSTLGQSGPSRARDRVGVSAGRNFSQLASNKAKKAPPDTNPDLFVEVLCAASAPDPRSRSSMWRLSIRQWSGPSKRLKGFQKVYLRPGETKRLSITLDRRCLAYYTAEASTWDFACGVYAILIRPSPRSPAR